MNIRTSRPVTQPIESIKFSYLDSKCLDADLCVKPCYTRKILTQSIVKHQRDVRVTAKKGCSNVKGASKGARLRRGMHKKFPHRENLAKNFQYQPRLNLSTRKFRLCRLTSTQSIEESDFLSRLLVCNLMMEKQIYNDRFKI